MIGQRLMGLWPWRLLVLLVVKKFAAKGTKRPHPLQRRAAHPRFPLVEAAGIGRKEFKIKHLL